MGYSFESFNQPTEKSYVYETKAPKKEEIGMRVDSSLFLSHQDRKELRKKRVNAYFHNKQKIAIDFSSVSVVGEGLNTMLFQLFKAGFKNVWKVPIPDAYIDNSFVAGTVAYVLIGFFNTFNVGDEFNYEATVKVYYYTKKRFVLSSFLANSLKKKHVDTASQVLRDVGFTNISAQPIFDLKFGFFNKPYSVDHITVWGIKPNNKSCAGWEYDVPIIIFYHDFKDEADRVSNGKQEQPN